ncbi:WS/DGAT/MGAT family acyltransferase [Nocardia tenerifensis]|uniref:Diacylglycerol O-acyltransferase n=1 Tax=Nocardia tenerifensis TaxID=228006 RepID=A0A318JS65_9NOCA|nr:wax ester/triacylglycerol synthase family O-acyltransferase [Nocardia tenerifensis]PXX58835.1 WS/DGAT/MGAT family acyltransferase [Nocardia tenerifensis]
MELIAPLDAIFLLGDRLGHPMHVAVLQVFDVPADAAPDFARRVQAELSADKAIDPAFRKRPRYLPFLPPLIWASDEDIDLRYHLRRVSVPHPGEAGQVLQLVSELHSTPLDDRRPLWETYLIDGASDGRIRLYSKVHHSVFDGVSVANVVHRSLAHEAGIAEGGAIWHTPRALESAGVASGPTLSAAAKSAAAAMSSVPTMIRATVFQQQLTLPYEAPRTMFNVPIGPERQCVVRSWKLERLMRAKRGLGVTVNDVVLAMAAGALRTYLIERDALPDKPLIALVPVSLRAKDRAEAAGGNKVGAVLCGLATDIANPLDRIRHIADSMRRSKQLYASLPTTNAMALSACVLGPLALSLLPGIHSGPPPFNVVVSNIPGPRRPLYWHGARLAASYPLSIVADGQAVNITVFSTANSLDVGIVGDDRRVPQLAGLLDHLENALGELE